MSQQLLTTNAQRTVTKKFSRQRDGNFLLAVGNFFKFQLVEFTRL